MAEEEGSVVSKPSPVSETLCLLYQKEKCGEKKKTKQQKTQGENFLRDQNRNLKRLEKQVSLKLQNQADATCWQSRILAVHRSLCLSPLLAAAVLLWLYSGLLLGKGCNISSSDSPSRISKRSPLSLHILASVPSHWQCHTAKARDCVKLLSTVVIGRDQTCCLWH